jgi:hypothetical protein
MLSSVAWACVHFRAGLYGIASIFFPAERMKCEKKPGRTALADPAADLVDPGDIRRLPSFVAAGLLAARSSQTVNMKFNSKLSNLRARS